MMNKLNANWLLSNYLTEHAPAECEIYSETSGATRMPSRAHLAILASSGLPLGRSGDLGPR